MQSTWQALDAGSVVEHVLCIDVRMIIMKLACFSTATFCLEAP